METWSEHENNGTMLRNVNTSATAWRNSGVVATVALFWIHSWVIWRLFYEQTGYCDVEFVVVLYGSERLWATWSDIMAIVRTHWRRTRKIRRGCRFGKWNPTGTCVESDEQREMPSRFEVPFFQCRVSWVGYRQREWEKMQGTWNISAPNQGSSQQIS